MFLSELTIESFRSFRRSQVCFDKHLTALVGENNSGKSNIIEAIRLVTQPLSDRRDRYCEDNDIRDGTPDPKKFTIEAQYDDLSITQKGLLISAVTDVRSNKAKFGLTYKPKTAQKPRGEIRYWAGAHGLEPESGSTDLIRHVYLPPLRDAQRVLASGNPTRILSLLRHFLGADENEQELANALSRQANHGTLTNINTSVGQLLNQLTVGVRPQTASMGFVENESLFEIARDLRFKLSDQGIPPEDLSNSGLGFANLLFMATILVELDKAADADLTLFLVEEPEAHLHPQLQATVLGFLLEKAEESRNKEVAAGKPEGRIQVIVTTHSPNLAAGVPPSHISVVRSIKPNPADRPESICIPVSKLGLSASDEGKLERYIDATKSEILFGQQCILIEGIAEAMLLPTIAKYYVFHGEDEANKANLKKFLATALIPIDGVDFKPYVNVLLSRYNDNCITQKVIVITDLDPTVPGNRQVDLEQRVRELGSEDHLDVFINQHTLESELYIGDNEQILEDTYLSLHPQSRDNWDELVGQADRNQKPARFVQLLKNSNTRKGDFAQLLVSKIEDIHNPAIETDFQFTPPQYLVDAIRAAV